MKRIIKIIIINHEIHRQKALEKELRYEFIRIDPDEENFNIFKAINEIHRHIKRNNNGGCRRILVKLV